MEVSICIWFKILDIPGANSSDSISGKVKVNEATIVSSNIPATNGVVHAIDTLLWTKMWQINSRRKMNNSKKVERKSDTFITDNNNLLTPYFFLMCIVNIEVMKLRNCTL